MVKVFAIDPGTYESAFIIWDGENIGGFGILPNEDMLFKILEPGIEELIIEKIACYGFPVGQSTLDTCEWTGRFDQQWFLLSGKRAILITKNQVQVHHCKTTRSVDANINQVLRDKYAYGVRNYGKGTKKDPGFFYGFKEKDHWDAFAVATCYTETHGFSKEEI
ncbi:hypothetical protein ES704_03642 [subsurface metagenome]